MARTTHSFDFLRFMTDKKRTGHKSLYWAS